MKNYLIMVSETTPLTLKGTDSDDHLRRLKSYQWCVVRNLGLFQFQSLEIAFYR